MHRAGFAGRDDDGGEVGAVVDPSGGASSGTVRLQLTVWEQWV
ncbi:hypothetical protein QFZ35_000994 [Arthrobacter ulcerisalmonis]|nr:hypothetical protein [Arthrobacter ulcerisalmonis]MDQ0662496.1 hypothetical protein [Arthrobacter ulcerisalmonis]